MTSTFLKAKKADQNISAPAGNIQNSLFTYAYLFYCSIQKSHFKVPFIICNDSLKPIGPRMVVVNICPGICLFSSSFNVCRSGVIPPIVINATLIWNWSHFISSSSMTEITFLPSSGLFDTKAGLYARLAAVVPSMYAVVRPSCNCVRAVFDMVYSVIVLFVSTGQFIFKCISFLFDKP